MSIIIKDKVYELADEGLHPVVITEVQDLGLVDTQFGTKDRVRLVFETQDQNDSEGQPIRLFVNANKSLHEKSTLGGLLKDLNIPVSSEFDVEDLVGIEAQVIVKHTTGKNGKTYANIVSFMKLKASKA